MKISSVLLLCIFFLSCTAEQQNYRSYIDLSGEWQFALDTADTGIQKKWFVTDLNDSIKLPGTTDSNEKGFLNTDTSTSHLNRVYKYEGAAWYRKKVKVPESFKNRHLQLFLERTRPSQVWVDGNLVGESKILQSPQQFDVTDYLSPGEHFITIRIDNRLELMPYRETHIFSEHTQTNWNGIIGEMYVEVMPKTYITNLQVYPNVAEQKIDVQLDVKNNLNWTNASIEFYVSRTGKGGKQQFPQKKIDTTLSSSISLEYVLGDATMLWDEYRQPLYQLTAVISNGEIKDSKTVSFGMREFKAEGTQFSINGRTTFLRGKNEAAVFPLTGYTPTDVESWTRVFRIAKSYGINHYRFHSYTPPEAAFTAADQTGIYLQPELPFWGGLDVDSVARMLREEGFGLLKAFANHPSFVMFAHGNEIWSGHDRVEANIAAFKEFDNRPLYTMGSNNSIGYVWPREVSDFHVAARTPFEHDTTQTHTRLTHAFADSRNGGILNTTYPSTKIDFSYPVSQIDIPLITHEIGQYQVYPDYDEIDKYTGVLRARNLEVFRSSLDEAGMLDQDSVFQQASGKWSAICYKAEMEAAIRTEGLAGFQLLDLQDFPGQGTALVGLLDAFMDSKGVISPKEWKQSCNDVVLLLEFPKYVWTQDETFKAKLEIANYSNKLLDQDIKWAVKTESGKKIREGELSGFVSEPGGLVEVDELAFDLESINKAQKLFINLSLEGTTYSNSYPLWVYPSGIKTEIPDDIMVAEGLTSEVSSALQNGEKVLFFPSPESVQENSVGGLFPPNFWNYEMFKGISESQDKPYSPGTLGLLTDPRHPVFNSFPTDFHTNWQWFSIIKASRPLILDQTADHYRPVVQVIDNLQRNHKMGLIFEFKVGKGKLLVCMSQLNQITDKPEALQLYRSIIRYMISDDFNPQYKISWQDLTDLLEE